MQTVVGSSPRTAGPSSATISSSVGTGRSGSHHSRTCGSDRQRTSIAYSSTSSRIGRIVSSPSRIGSIAREACQSRRLRSRHDDDRGPVVTAEAWAVALAAAMVGAFAGLSFALWRRPATGGEASLKAQLDVQSAELRRLADAAAQRELANEQLRSGMEGARRALDELRAREQERRVTDAEHRDVVRRLATVLAGGASKGRAGEQVLREHLAQLPPGMLASDVRVN